VQQQLMRSSGSMANQSPGSIRALFQ